MTIVTRRTRSDLHLAAYNLAEQSDHMWAFNNKCQMQNAGNRDSMYHIRLCLLLAATGQQTYVKVVLISVAVGDF